MLGINNLKTETAQNGGTLFWGEFVTPEGAVPLTGCVDIHGRIHISDAMGGDVRSLAMTLTRIAIDHDLYRAHIFGAHKQPG